MAVAKGETGIGFHNEYKIILTPFLEYLDCTYTLEFDDNKKNMITLKDFSGSFVSSCHREKLPDSLKAYWKITLLNSDTPIKAYMENAINITTSVHRELQNAIQYRFSMKAGQQIQSDLFELLLDHNANNSSGFIELVLENSFSGNEGINPLDGEEFRIIADVSCTLEVTTGELSDAKIGDPVSFRITGPSNSYTIPEGSSFRLIIWDDDSTEGVYDYTEWNNRPSNRALYDLGTDLSKRVDWRIGFDEKNEFIFPIKKKTEEIRIAGATPTYNYYSYALQLTKTKDGRLLTLTVFQAQDTIKVKFTHKPYLINFGLISTDYPGMTVPYMQYNVTGSLWIGNFSRDLDSLPVKFHLYCHNAQGGDTREYNNNLSVEKHLIGHIVRFQLGEISKDYQPDEISVTVSFPQAKPDKTIQQIISYNAADNSLYNNNKELKAKEWRIVNSSDYIVMEEFLVDENTAPRYSLRGIRMKVGLPKGYIHSRYEGQAVTLFLRIFVRKEKITVTQVSGQTTPITTIELKKVRIRLTPAISRFIKRNNVFIFNPTDDQGYKKWNDVQLTSLDNMEFSLYTKDLHDRYTANSYCIPIIEGEIYLLDFNGNRI
ncbi:MAG: hypothetical protein JXJ04_16715 [Spirochaetales bacterium]|nr:hypothetical protein [Spirochaetales bacterium]